MVLRLLLLSMTVFSYVGLFLSRERDSLKNIFKNGGGGGGGGEGEESPTTPVLISSSAFSYSQNVQFSSRKGHDTVPGSDITPQPTWTNWDSERRRIARLVFLLVNNNTVVIFNQFKRFASYVE